MMTPATHNAPDTTTEGVLFVAFERSEKTWKLGFRIGHGQQPHERTLPAREQQRVRDAIAHATARFGLPDTAPVVSCYEAGREGFWLHRFVQAQGVSNHGVDSSSIEVNRRTRRATSEPLAGCTLLRMLRRSHHGDRRGWRMGTVPAVEAEEQRHLHRDLHTLKQERARTTTRSKGVRRSQGVRLASVHK